MKILVTGGSGLVGKFVVDYLRREHSVTVLDIKPPADAAIEFVEADVCSPDSVKNSLRASRFDAIVHLAGIPHPLNDPPEKVFVVNSSGTYNMLEAGVRMGVPLFVFMSSESTLGLAFSTRRCVPEYFPIDEFHPLRPQDPYGLSKVTGELLCRGCTARTGMRTIAIRCPWIWVPQDEERKFYRRLVDEYEQWHKNLWAYVHVHDVAEGIAAVLSNPTLPLHDIFFLCARESWAPVPSRELIARWYPEVKKISETFGGHDSLISAIKAQRVLGIALKRTKEDILRA